jgi:hypothetical protein
VSFPQIFSQLWKTHKSRRAADVDSTRKPVGLLLGGLIFAKPRCSKLSIYLNNGREGSIGKMGMQQKKTKKYDATRELETLDWSGFQDHEASRTMMDCGSRLVVGDRKKVAKLK